MTAAASNAEEGIWGAARSTTFRSEADVEQWLVLPLLRALGYEDTDIRAKAPIVFQEGRTGRPHEADFIVYNGPIRDRSTSLMVVEAKKPGEPLAAAVPQAESYAFNSRAPFLLLTNGTELEIWQLQPGGDSERQFSCAIADLATHRGPIEALIGRDAAADHCRSLGIKPLAIATGDFERYETAELKRFGDDEGVDRTLRDLAGGAALSSRYLPAAVSRPAVIFAASGFGKTTLLLDLHRRALKERLSQSTGLLSFLVELPDLAATDVTIAQYAADRLGAHCPGVTRRTFDDLLRNQGCLILCDRMDRVPAAAQAKITADLKNLVRDHPLCRVIVFDRVPVGQRLGWLDIELVELNRAEQKALAELISPDHSGYWLASLPAALGKLVSHPLLLALIMRHRAEKGSFPHRLTQLFETWVGQLLEASSRPASQRVRLTAALEILADLTAGSAPRVETAIQELENAGHSEVEFDELVRLGAVRAGHTVELHHEALADFLRARKLVAGDNATASSVAALDLTAGSLLPALLIERADDPAVQRAVWNRLSQFRLTTYAEALRYRGDLSRHYSKLRPEEASRAFAQDVLLGITEPLAGFFPQLAGRLVSAMADEGVDELAIAGELSEGGESFTYALQGRSPGKEAVLVGTPVSGRISSHSVQRGGFRLDSGRLLGFLRLRSELERLVNARGVYGGPVLANERLIGRLRFLEEEYGFLIKGVTLLRDVELLLGPHRGRFAGPAIPAAKGGGFFIDDLFEDIDTLRESGQTKIDWWWTRHGKINAANPEGSAILLNQHWARAQQAYRELVERSFGAIADELEFYKALPVRYDVSLVQGAMEAPGWYYSWLPVRTWEEAGANVSFAAERPRLDFDGQFEAAAAAFARLGRDGLRSLTTVATLPPDFDGHLPNGLFDGETATLRAAFDMLHGDLERSLRWLPYRDSDA